MNNIVSTLLVERSITEPMEIWKKQSVREGMVRITEDGRYLPKGERIKGH